MKSLHYSIYQFPEILIQPKQLEYLRGSVNEATGNQFVTFHNHNQSLDYPYTQYKLVRSKAGFVALGEQAIREAIQLSNALPDTITIDQLRQQFSTNMECMDAGVFQPGLSSSLLRYRSNNLLPFDAKNYKKVGQRLWEDPAFRIELYEHLDRILVREIRNFYKQVCLATDNELEAVRVRVVKFEPALYNANPKGISGFKKCSVVFDTNFKLLPESGIGEFSYLGYGTIRPVRWRR